MRMRWTMLAVGALAFGATGRATAQRSWAITPYVTYVMPSGNLVEGIFLNLETAAGVNVGIQGEVALAKQLALAGHAASTLGLSSATTFVFDPTGASTSTEFANAWTQFGATLILRPLGTLPNGAPKTFWLEGGAEMTRYGLAAPVDRTAGGGSDLSWSGSWVSAVAGAGFTFRLTPRLTANVFGRYSFALSEYSSPGLDDWNSPCPDPNDATCVDFGQKVNLLQIGVGIRAGR